MDVAKLVLEAKPVSPKENTDQALRLQQVPLAWQNDKPEATLGHAGEAKPSAPSPINTPCATAVPTGVPPAGRCVCGRGPIPSHQPVQQTDTWSTGLCDCDGLWSNEGCTGDCCLAVFCGCVIYGENVEALKADEAFCGRSKQGACWGYCCLEMLPSFLMLGFHVPPFRPPGCGCLVHKHTRRVIRSNPEPWSLSPKSLSLHINPLEH